MNLEPMFSVKKKRNKNISIFFNFFARVSGDELWNPAQIYVLWELVPGSLKDYIQYTALFITNIYQPKKESGRKGKYTCHRSNFVSLRVPSPSPYSPLLPIFKCSGAQLATPLPQTWIRG